MTQPIGSRLLLLVLTLALAAPLLARPIDPPVVAPAQLPFAANEELVYEGEYSRLVLRGIDIADLTFRVEPGGGPGGAGKEQVLHISAEALSKGIVTKLFGLKFRQRIDSTVAVEPFGAQLTVKSDEQGKRIRTSEAVFDGSQGKVTYTERDPNDAEKPPRIVASPLLGSAQDIASVFYFLRTQKLEPGTTFTVQVSDSGQVYPVTIKISEGKKLKTVLGKVKTVQVEPDMFGDGKILHGKGSLVIWMTADRRHIPVQAQIKAEVGTIDIKLKRASLGNP